MDANIIAACFDGLNESVIVAPSFAYEPFP